MKSEFKMIMIWIYRKNYFVQKSNNNAIKWLKKYKKENQINFKHLRKNIMKNLFGHLVKKRLRNQKKLVLVLIIVKMKITIQIFSMKNFQYWMYKANLRLNY